MFHHLGKDLDDRDHLCQENHLHSCLDDKIMKNFRVENYQTDCKSLISWRGLDAYYKAQTREGGEANKGRGWITFFEITFKRPRLILFGGKMRATRSKVNKISER